MTRSFPLVAQVNRPIEHLQIWRDVTDFVIGKEEKWTDGINWMIQRKIKDRIRMFEIKSGCVWVVQEHLDTPV